MIHLVSCDSNCYFINTPLKFIYLPYDDTSKLTIKKFQNIEYLNADFAIENAYHYCTKEREAKMLRMCDSVVISFIELIPYDRLIKMKVFNFHFYEGYVAADYIQNKRMFDHPIEHEYPNSLIFYGHIDFDKNHNLCKSKYTIGASGIGNKLKFHYPKGELGTIYERKLCSPVRLSVSE